MADYQFWKKMSRQFRELNCAQAVRLQWEANHETDEIRNKAVFRAVNIHHLSARKAVEALAIEAAWSIDSNSDRPLDLWFDTLLNEKDFRSENPTAVGDRWFRHMIVDLCEASAALCTILQMREMEAEQGVNRESKPGVPEPGVATTSVSVSAQLEPLRIEADISQERLAELVGIDIRNVQRHLSGVTKPTKRNIFRYQREFSKLLKRNIVINRMP